MNKIILSGRLTEAPVVRYTTTGKVVCQFTLAVQRGFKNPEGNYDADFIQVVLWGPAGERLGNTVTKGQRIIVEGRLQIRSYKTKNNTTRWITEVISNTFEYAESKPQSTADFGNEFGEKKNVPFDEEIPF